MEESDALTVEQAIAMLPQKELVHVFRNPSGMLVGADWRRADAEELVRRSRERRTAGPMASALGHGLAVRAENGRTLFVETAPERRPEGAGDAPPA